MKLDSVIFDMDGVLIDVTYSYRVAIRKTTNFFLKQKDLSIKATQKDVGEIKDLPGFNNDWDATYALITFLSKGIKKEKFAKEVKTLNSINKQAKEYKEIKDIFQTFYLGDFLFKKIEKREPPIFVMQGLILAEKCLVSKKILEALINKDLKLGIATGRPREEALFAIKRFNLQEFFPENYIVALGDTIKEKPDPDPIIEVKKRMQVQNPIYIGDTISDVISAKKAKMPCIFIGSKKLGDVQISDVNSLKEILL